MTPDFILTATPSNQRLLTPLSNFGKMVIKNIEGFPTIGPALLLTQEQGFFVADVLNSWGYTIRQRNFHCQTSTASTGTTTVKDTRPRLQSKTFTGYGKNFFPNQNGSKESLSDRQQAVIRSLANYRSPNPRLIKVPLNNYTQLTPTNDYPINCSHSTGSPHTTKITREKII